MGVEIERKFLVRGADWQELVTSRTSIRQAYLVSAEKVSVRVRITGDGVATLSVKSRPGNLRRLEVECNIQVSEAEALMDLRQGSVIEKTRSLVPWGGLTWEIDVFAGENAGLILAEIELRNEHQSIELPGWIGPEVTGQHPYYNHTLAQHPFCTWSHGQATTRTENEAV